MAIVVLEGEPPGAADVAVGVEPTALFGAEPPAEGVAAGVAAGVEGPDVELVDVVVAVDGVPPLPGAVRPVNAVATSEDDK
jgi:hypothetical protein